MVTRCSATSRHAAATGTRRRIDSLGHTQSSVPRSAAKTAFPRMLQLLTRLWNSPGRTRERDSGFHSWVFLFWADWFIYLSIYLRPLQRNFGIFDEVRQRRGPEETSRRWCVHTDTRTTHTRRALSVSLWKRQYQIFQGNANRLPQTSRTPGREWDGASKIQIRCMDMCMNYSVTIFVMGNCIAGL